MGSECSSKSETGRTVRKEGDMKEPEALAAEHFEGKILGHVTNFYGICPDCLKKDTM